MEYQGIRHHGPPAWIGMTPAPDPGFVRKLKAYSPDLDIRFSRNWGCFVITQKSQMSGDVPLFRIDGDNTGGGYRQPDDRDIMKIYEADRWNRSEHDWKSTIKRGEDYMLQHEIDQDERVKAELRDVTKDDKLQLINAYKNAFNLGKVGSEFRKVEVKAKSKPSLGRAVKTFK